MQTQAFTGEPVWFHNGIKWKV